VQIPPGVADPVTGQLLRDLGAAMWAG
jgi:hypothetical protein